MARLHYLYERERYQAAGHTVDRGIAEADKYYGMESSCASANVLKSRADTIGGRLFREIPDLQIAPYNAEYEVANAATRLADSLAGTLNRPEAKAVLERVGMDGLITGFGAVLPMVEAGRLKLVRVRYKQLFWDAVDAENGNPRSLHYWARVDRGQAVAMAQAWDARKRDIDAIWALEPAGAAGPWDGIEGDILSPYEREMFGDEGTALDSHGSDLVHVLYSWRLPGGPKTKDGRCVVTLHGATAKDDEGVTLWDKEWTRQTFPVIWWSPWPTLSGGSDGQGLGHTIAPYQRQIDRSWSKSDREIKKYGQPRLVTTDPDMAAEIDPDEATVIVVGKDKALLAHGKPYEINWDVPQHPAEHAWMERVMGTMDALVGVNSMLSQGGTGRGANASALSMYEEDDRQMERFADVEAQWDQCLVRTGGETLNCLDDEAARDAEFEHQFLGKDSSEARQRWADLSMPRESYNIQIEPVGVLGRRRSGRIAKTLELIQSGALDQDAAMAEVATHADLRRLTQRQLAGYHLVNWQIAGLATPGLEPSDYSAYWPTKETPLALAAGLGMAAVQEAQRKRAKPETMARLREYVAAVKGLMDAQPKPAQPDMELPPEAAAMMPPA